MSGLRLTPDLSRRLRHLVQAGEHGQPVTAAHDGLIRCGFAEPFTHPHYQRDQRVRITALGARLYPLTEEPPDDRRFT